MDRLATGLILENELQEGGALRDRQGPHVMNDPLIEGKVGVLGFLSVEKRLSFLGLNACPAANNVPNLLLPDLNALQSLC